MSIVIGQPTTKIITTHQDFLAVNPWFELTVYEKVINSQRLEDKVNSIFKKCCVNTKNWEALVSRLDAHVERKVSSLVENKEELREIRDKCISDINKKCNDYIADAEEQRNKRLDKYEEELESVKSSQVLTFFGGTFLGLFLGLIQHSIL